MSTYTAKQYKVGGFSIAGTLEGDIDLATPNGTHLITPAEARLLAAALSGAANDVRQNCKYDKDSLLVDGGG